MENTDAIKYLNREAHPFRAAKLAEFAEAAQRVALQLVCGIDLDMITNASRSEGLAALSRLERLTERERLRGLSHHWSYDLNRHIALKQVAQRLRESVGDEEPSHARRHGAPNENGARRRRSRSYAG